MRYIAQYCFLWSILSLTLNFSLAEKYDLTYHDYFFSEEISFFDEASKKHFIEEYEGKTILLVFWAKWCGACLSELPLLDNLQKDFRKLPFKIIAISEDKQSPALIKEFFSAYEINFLEIFYDPKNTLLNLLNLGGLPSAFLLDKEGKVKIKFQGNIKWQEEKIRQIILPYIGEEYEMPKNSYKEKDFLKTMP
jgi:thiol-disulfide isomerase/thioredoxin